MEAMESRPAVARDDWPLLVKLGLWQVKTRGAARIFAGVSVAGAVVSVALGFRIGALLMFAALWYWLAMRWVDAHGRWE